MFGVFKKAKSEYAKGQAVGCLKGYLKKSAMDVFADMDVFAIIDTYSNNLVDINVRLFSTDKPQYNVYVVSLGCLLKALNDEYWFDRINQLDKVVAHAALSLGTDIENNLKLKNSFSELDAGLFIGISKEMIKKIDVINAYLENDPESLDDIEKSNESTDSSKIAKSASPLIQEFYNYYGVTEKYLENIDKEIESRKLMDAKASQDDSKEELTISKKDILQIVTILTKITYCDRDIDDKKVYRILEDILKKFVNSLSVETSVREEGYNYLQPLIKRPVHESYTSITGYAEKLKFDEGLFKREIVMGFICMFTLKTLPLTLKRESLLKKVLEVVYPDKDMKTVIQELSDYFTKNREEFKV